MLKRLVCHFIVKIATCILGTQYFGIRSVLGTCLSVSAALVSYAHCTFTTLTDSNRTRTSGIHATNAETKDPLILAFVLFGSHQE